MFALRLAPNSQNRTAVILSIADRLLPPPEIAPLRFRLGTRRRRIPPRSCLADSVSKAPTAHFAGKSAGVCSCTSREPNSLRMRSCKKTGGVMCPKLPLSFVATAATPAESAPARLARASSLESALAQITNLRLLECALTKKTPPQGGATAANVILAANVYQQDELRGVKKVIRSFAASTKSGVPRMVVP
jgi:hypothetical protein